MSSTDTTFTVAPSMVELESTITEFVSSFEVQS